MVPCDNLEGGDGVGGGRDLQERWDIYIYLWLIHVDIWQKPTQYCKAIIFQLKINSIFKSIDKNVLLVFSSYIGG